MTPTALETPPPALECRGVEKAFGPVPVLRDVSLALESGTVTALAGENGAGKSTLMKIMSGQLRPDAGEVVVAGAPLRHADARQARALGVGTQELAAILDMTVYENLFVGRELRRRSGLLDRRRMAARARELLEVVALRIVQDKPVGKRYSYVMPPITMDNVSTYLQHVVTDKDAFLKRLPRWPATSMPTTRSARVKEAVHGLAGHMGNM